MTDDKLLNENPVLYFKQKREKALEEAPALIEDGHSLIYPELHDDWDKLVSESVGSVYCGDEIKVALKIMTSLNMGASMDEAKQIFENFGGAGISTLTANIIRDFGKQGPEFWLAVTPGEISVEDLRILSNVQKRNSAIERNHDSSKLISNPK